MPTATDAETEDLLARGELTPVARIRGSSNGALLCEVGAPGETLLAIYKPVTTERPLWDFPDGTLAGRERAAYVVSSVGGFSVVPPTVLRDGPRGTGAVQQWVGDPTVEPDLVVAVTALSQVPDGWRVVVRGEGERGERLVVSHADEAPVRTTAVLDALINNSDRKGGHLVRDGSGVRGFDHGVSLGVEPKLRTVLWGWAGEPLTDADLARLSRVSEALEHPGPVLDELAGLLTGDEVRALRSRAAHLMSTGRHPLPHGGWPAIPWPAM